MKPKTMILMVVAVACGLGASIMTSRLLADRSKSDAEPEIPVLVSKAKVPGWTAIKDPDKMFAVKMYPANLAPRGAVGDLEKMKSQKLNKNLGEGHLLTEADMLSKEQQSISELLKPGQRATSIKVNAQSSVAGFVLPGTRVDITLTTRGNNKGATKTILQHVLVMAVDNTSERQADTKHIIGQTVTVAATPEEAARLSLAQSLGDLQLQVKNPGDTARIRPVTIREEDLDRPPLPAGEKPDEVVKSEATKLPTGALPVLPPEDPKKEEVKTVAKVEKAAPVRRHVMRIVEGGRTSKAVFMLGEKDPDEDDYGTPSGGAATMPADVKKPVDASRPAMPPPVPTRPMTGPAKTGRTRTGG